MTTEELEIKKFELLQQVQLEELELKKKDLELKIQEQKSKRIATPIIISLVGGFITIFTGIILKYIDSKTTLDLEDRKFQSSLLLKATEAKNYDEFSDMLLTFQENGLLNIDSIKIANIRKKRFVSERLNGNQHYENSPEPIAEGDYDNSVATGLDVDSGPPLPHSVAPTELSLPNDSTLYWIIVSGGESNLLSAKEKEQKAIINGFKIVNVWFNNDSYRTCIGHYSNYSDAINDLFTVKETINRTAYVVKSNDWCAKFKFDSKNKVNICL